MDNLRGSIPFVRQPSIRESDLELQNQERECLASLLTEEEYFYRESSPSSGILNVFPSSDFPVQAFSVPQDQVKNVIDRIRNIQRDFDPSTASVIIRDHIIGAFNPGLACSLNHLPSIQVQFSYPENYPSHSPPEVKLLCPWMEVKTLSYLESSITTLWERTRRLAVMYTVYEYLRNILDDPDVFPLNRLLILISDTVPEFGGNVIAVKDAKLFVDTLILHDSQRSDVLFEREIHQCPVCMEYRSGKGYARLRACGHRCCKECLRRTCETQVFDGGSTRLIRCLECDEELHPNDVANLIAPDQVERYQQLQLDMALTSMGDIVYCPRPQCNAAVIKESDGNIAQCPCGFVFCTVCRKSSHGVAPCQIQSVSELEDKLAELAVDADSADVNSEKDYLRNRLLHAIGIARSELYIEERIKRCPNCGAPVQKNLGCNHIGCRCGGHFCYICLTLLDETNPYKHFRDFPECSGSGAIQDPSPLPDDDMDEHNTLRAVDEMADALLPQPELWFQLDDDDIQGRLRGALRRRTEPLNGHEA